MTQIHRSALDLVVYDFDGVMTDNRVLVTEEGREAVWVSRADGWGIRLLREKGVSQVILSTETNAVVRERAKKVGLPVLQGAEDKRQVLDRYRTECGASMARILYVGNDTNDLEVMRAVGYAVAPADAHPTIRAMAHLVLKTCGGCGVVRELEEYII